MDKRREEAKIDLEDSDAMKGVNGIVIELVSDLHPKRTVPIDSCLCLRSLKGDKAQLLHRDFPVYETTEAIIHHRWIQASAFLALEDDTKLLVIPTCFGATSEFCSTLRVVPNRDCNSKQ
ncbi:hypothetical protein PHMEG_0001783 [Phytophthora megakarya]|uniref:Uncharacterized protein n=1 Tax=Phytophthora megakarya TaxID=4795 RepID=A0A225X263_9STRA|nr:hypothetical protein PHMEG_0001783 [Phytophthora megakarya]